MKRFLYELKSRNAALYWFGWLMLAGGLFSMFMIGLDDTIVLGINAWIKPMKFFLSSAIFSWSMGWFMVYLKEQRKVQWYSWVLIVVMIFELAVITWQAAKGRLSHFNVSTPVYALLFAVMGLFISLLMIWTAYIGYLFFRQKTFPVPMPYIWGIRLGILIFVIFSFEGGLMAAQLSHTVGAPDGSAGLPVTNWSKQYGDLRVAHFVGIHSLQILPLFGYFVGKTNRGVQVFSTIYFLLTTLIFIQALLGKPLFF